MTPHPTNTSLEWTRGGTEWRTVREGTRRRVGRVHELQDALGTPRTPTRELYEMRDIELCAMITRLEREREMAGLFGMGGG